MSALENGLDENNPKLNNGSPATILKYLVTTLYHKNNKGVAILIDEYDAPIHRVIGDIKQAEKNCLTLNDFYFGIENLK
jgi:hypothetical protein